MRKLPKSPGRRTVIRLAAAAFDKWMEQINSEPCAWCTLPRGEHTKGPKGLGHPWISLEMDMLIRYKGNRYLFPTKPLSWKVRIK